MNKLAHKVDRTFKYDPAVATDIRKRFRKVRLQLKKQEQRKELTHDNVR